MYAFVFRLYDPGDFMDHSYVIMDPLDGRVTYTIRISLEIEVDGVKTEKELECPGFVPIHATNPFGTRTHILSNPHSTIRIGDRVLTVFKDQFCRPDPRFDEYGVLTHIHGPETMPGVVEAVYHKLIEIPERFNVSRQKHRIGLRQLGSPITSVPNLKGMLEIVFDVLEGNPILFTMSDAHLFAVLRYLRCNRNVLHRDISWGNVLYIDEQTTPADVEYKAQDSEPKEVPLCFIKYLLNERYIYIDWDWGY
jgi:hypothetical protein